MLFIIIFALSSFSTWSSMLRISGYLKCVENVIFLREKISQDLIGLLLTLNNQIRDPLEFRTRLED